MRPSNTCLKYDFISEMLSSLYLYTISMLKSFSCIQPVHEGKNMKENCKFQNDGVASFFFNYYYFKLVKQLKIFVLLIVLINEEVKLTTPQMLWIKFEI